MKRFVLSVFCVALMSSCAWAGTLTAIYTYDSADVTEDSSKFQIEAEREVRFTYNLSGSETSEDCSIYFTDGTLDSMDVFGDKQMVYTRTFSTTGEVGISVDISGSVRTRSADITEALLIELEQPKLTLKTGQQTIIYFDEKGSNKVTDFDVEVEISSVWATAVYDGGSKEWNRSPQIVLTAGSSEGTSSVIPPLKVKFTKKSDSTKTFSRQCAITITNSGSTGGGGGGGGCNGNAGLAGLGLLALLPLAARRKR